jgi:hypothetical protein
VLPDPPLFSATPLLGWAILAIVALVVVSIAIRIVRKAIKVSIRLAMLAGFLALIGAGLCWLSSILGARGAPFL